MDNIRIVSQSGRYRLYHCDISDEGDVDAIYDEVSLRATSFKDMAELLDGIAFARKFPALIVNAGNKKEFMRDSDGS